MNNIFKISIITASLIVFSGCAATIYDEDLDGVQNNKDICLGTPRYSKVTKYGCALDTDNDGVLDIYDKCPNSIFTDIVDATGCKR